MSDSISEESKFEPKVKSKSDQPFFLCRRCGYVRIYFIKGTALPYQWKDDQIHYCEVGNSFSCIYCEKLIYLDRRVLDSNSRRIPLNYDTGKYHQCSKRKEVRVED